MATFGFIGTGHMGCILVRKFIETDLMRPEDIIGSNKTQRRVLELAHETGIKTGNNRQVARSSDVIFLCVRSLDIKDVLKELSDDLTPDKLLVSVSLNFSLENLRALCRARIARVVPSIVSERLVGISLVAMGDNATARDRDLVFSLFSAIGEAVEVEENDFEILADLTSCGPGYIAALLREFALVASWKGVSRDQAEDLVRKTMIGTARLLEEMGLEELISCVATRGGITEEGIKVIRKEAPTMFDQLFQATQSKHELIKKLIQKQE